MLPGWTTISKRKSGGKWRRKKYMKAAAAAAAGTMEREADRKESQTPRKIHFMPV